MRGIESTTYLAVPRYLTFYLTPNSLGDTAPGTCRPRPFFELYIDFRARKVTTSPSSQITLFNYSDFPYIRQNIRRMSAVTDPAQSRLLVVSATMWMLQLMLPKFRPHPAKESWRR